MLNFVAVRNACNNGAPHFNIQNSLFNIQKNIPAFAGRDIYHL